MGIARSDPNDWKQFHKTAATQTQAQTFAHGVQHGMHPDLDPRNIVVRESCDSTANPNSTPLIVGLDHTGSMGQLAHAMAKDGLGKLIEDIYDRRPILDPHVLLAVVGDVFCDQAPLQATQFEADIALSKQLTNFYLEGNGGGNGGESYNAVWWFAATKTKCDSMLKRNKKGYLFTVGDEPPHMTLPADAIKHFLGGGSEKDISTKDLLTMVSRDWEVFHLMVEEGGHGGDRARKAWRDLLGERAISLTDHRLMPEVIVSTLQVIEGANPQTVINSWSGKTALVVADAVGSLTKSNTTQAAGVVRL